MPHRHDDKSTHAAIVAALRVSSIPNLQKRRLLILMRIGPFCELMCDRVERKLIESGTITAEQQWNPETWDWDAVIDRIKELVDYLIEIAPAIIEIILSVIDIFTE